MNEGVILFALQEEYFRENCRKRAERSYPKKHSFVSERPSALFVCVINLSQKFVFETRNIILVCVGCQLQKTVRSFAKNIIIKSK